MKGILQFLNLMGGLGVFLVGMRIMSDGIQKRAGNRLKSVLHTMTENRFAGVLTGVGVTSIIQSSSATTVLLVSLVNAGLVTLKQSNWCDYGCQHWYHSHSLDCVHCWIQVQNCQCGLASHCGGHSILLQCTNKTAGDCGYSHWFWFAVLGPQFHEGFGA